MQRRAIRRRETKEVTIKVELSLDGSGRAELATGLAFLDHLLETLVFYAGFDCKIEVTEQKRVDDHHIAEDTAIALGEAIREAAGTNVARYGYSIVPMDDALILAAVDYSGRPGAWIDLKFTRETIGDLATENIIHFLGTLAASARITLHVNKLAGYNDHHIAEAAFKALGLALRQALAPSGRILSTKGTIG